MAGEQDATRIDLAKKALQKAQLVLEDSSTTPIMMAAYNGDEEAVVELLQVARETREQLRQVEDARLNERMEEEKQMKVVQEVEATARSNLQVATAPLHEIYRTGAHVLKAVKPKVKELEQIQTKMQAKVDAAHIDVLAQGEKEKQSSDIYESKVRQLKSRLKETDCSHARPDGFTPLTIAAKKKEAGAVRLLAAESADIDTIITNIWVTPLWGACWQGDIPTVKVCVEAKANLNWQDTRGATPLIVASQQGHVEAVEVLIEAAADVTIEDDGGRCALWRACLKGNSEVVNYFIQNGMSVHKEKAEAQRALADLEKAREDLTKAEGTRDAYVVALRAKDKAVKEKTLAIEKVRRGPARDAAKKEVEEAKEEAAAASHALEMTDQKIKDAKLEVNWRITCSEKEVAEAIEASRRVNCPDYRGMTTTYVAAEQGHYDTLDLIIKARADVDLVTTEVDGQVTPMAVAARNGRDEAILQIFNAKGNPNQRCGDGSTPIMYACRNGHVSTLLALLYCKVFSEALGSLFRTYLSPIGSIVSAE